MVKTKIEMSAEDMKKRLMEVDKQIDMLNKMLVDAKMKLGKFLDKKDPDEFTRQLYINNVRFNPQSLVFSSDTLNRLNQEKDQLKEAYINKVREGLIIEFCLENPDLKDKLKDITIERTESGVHAKVIFN
jgi:hypothetical protein